VAVMFIICGRKFSKIIIISGNLFKNLYKVCSHIVWGHY
jgi:hypothetical protein